MSTGARAAHWADIYRTKPDDDLSWFQAVPEPSRSWLRRIAPPPRSVLDVGGGNSSLAVGLVDAGYSPVAVLDIAGPALERAKARAGPSERRIRWIEGDVTRLPDVGRFDVWHDRAVFHFLTSEDERTAYRTLASRSLAAGGALCVATFAPDGPSQCSGLPVVRYDGPGLARELGDGFELIETFRDVHRTPWGTEQPFCYAAFHRRP